MCCGNYTDRAGKSGQGSDICDYVFVLQQIEGNLIYPHVVGSSVGLPGMWVLMAVTVGGSLFGIVGMLTFIPICSVCYALFRLFVNERLKEKREI